MYRQQGALFEWYCMVSMALSCIDTLEVILSDCHNTLARAECIIYSFVELAGEVGFAKLTKILLSVHDSVWPLGGHLS